MERLDTVVVGAGVVGLAVGRALALTGRDVVVLEAEGHVGMHCSSRNSEVIHAGIYYPQGSLKARLCVAGKALLYAYCSAHDVRHEQIGKLIVATSEEDRVKLGEIQQRASANGVTDLRMLGADAVRELEPNVQAIAALHSPSTGIVDTHELMMSLQGDIENAGGVVVLNSRVTNVGVADDRMHFAVGDDEFECRTLVNSAGLWADELVGDLKELDGKRPHLNYAIGHYFSLPGRSPFRRLIYPVPAGGGLGIHATNDMGGAVRFGPDVTWIDAVDYAFNDSRKGDFVTAIKSYYPGLDETRLQPAYTGIRPKLHGPGEPAADFAIRTAADHGVRGLINLFGIESPGLTASLSIAAYVAKSL